MKRYAFLIVAALFVPGVAQAADNGCNFAAPSPLLKPHAYAGQSFMAKPDNAAVETATLSGGARLTINLSQCVDAIGHEFVLTVPADPKIKRDFAGWVDFGLATLSGLKVREASATSELIGFLEKARGIKPKNGVVALCRDGKGAAPCSWESGGEFRIEVRPAAAGTRLTIAESVSG